MSTKSSKIDLGHAPVLSGSSYPDPHHLPVVARTRRRLAAAAGLTDFGVNLLELPPGVWSSQRHWHSHEDEFIHVLEGEVVLVTDAGEETLRAGDCAAFKAGVPDGHHLVNRSDRLARVLEVGSDHPDKDVATYSDIDMMAHPDEPHMRHKDGTPYPERPRR